MGYALQGHLMMSNRYANFEVNMFDGIEDISICKKNFNQRRRRGKCNSILIPYSSNSQAKKGHNFGKMQSRVMELAPVVATMMSDNYVEFQSS